jgi:hypothetical protein
MLPKPRHPKLSADPVTPIEMRLDDSAPPGNVAPTLAHLLRRLRDRQRTAAQAAGAAALADAEAKPAAKKKIKGGVNIA